MELGAVDCAFLEWLMVTLEQCATTPKLQAFVPRLRTQLSRTDGQLIAVAQHMAVEDGRGAMLQHYPVPLLQLQTLAVLKRTASVSVPDCGTLSA